MKVSFDFDGTLALESVQKYAKELVNKGIEVWITTRRYDTLERYTEDFQIKYKIINLESEHKYLFEVADKLGISRNHIIFTNMNDKYPFVQNMGFIWHLDDDQFELDDINQFTDVIGISVHGNYRHKCNKLLNESD